MATGTGYIFMTDEEDRMFVHNYLYHNSQTGLTDMALFQAYIRQFCKLVFAIEVIATVVIGSMMIRRYDRMVDEFYADTDDKSMRNIQSILYLVLTIAILSFIVNIIGRARFTDHKIILATTSLMFSALLFAIGYQGLHRHFSIIDMRTNKEQVSNDDSAALKDAVNRSMTERIIALVENDKIYLQPDLKLDDLAQMMHTNRTYIYQAVNQQMGISFNEFINRYRIAHAKRLMASDPTLSMNDVALHSGFASLSSFYRNMKKYN
jgi:AraC-like DNA-binding protein